MANPKTSTLPEVTSWSYSRWRDYERCPYFFRKKYLEKLSDGGENSPAILRGQVIGKTAEDYLKGILPPKLPKELNGPLGVRMQAARKRADKGLGTTVFVEQMLCFNRQWQRVPSKDFKNIWLRVKMDLCGIDENMLLKPIDLKTGKYRPDELATYLDQLDIYSVGGMCAYPETVASYPELWFLDAGVAYPECEPDQPAIVYERSDIPEMQARWEVRVRNMFSDRRYDPKPNSKCGWCAFSHGNGGTCRF